MKTIGQKAQEIFNKFSSSDEHIEYVKLLSKNAVDLIIECIKEDFGKPGSESLINWYEKVKIEIDAIT